MWWVLAVLCIQVMRAQAQSPTFKGLPSIKELTESAGVRSEPFLVLTEDGYYLWMYRLGNNTGPPVVILHGILLGPDSWLTRGKDHDLAYLLLDEGYDVYLVTIRGSAFNRNHVKYKRTDPNFWNFSFHEAGLYDLPAIIDYILQRTGSKKLSYIGHSQGVTAFLVMTSMRPKYNEKVTVGVLVSPVAFAPRLTEFAPFFFRIAALNTNLIYKILHGAGHYEIFPRTEKVIKFVQHFCGNRPTQDFCLDFYGIAFGENRINLDRTKFGFQSSFAPAGTSANTLLHFGQIYTTGEFKLLDYGAKANLEKYNSTRPPDYPLENVTCPVAVFWSINDHLTSQWSVKKLVSKLPNVILESVIRDYKYSHLDPVIGVNTKEVLYDDIIKLLNKVS